MNTTPKTRVGIIYGGKSAEHDISIQSAGNVFEALDPNMFEPVLIGIDRNGVWHLEDPSALRAGTLGGGAKLALSPGDRQIKTAHESLMLDVIFPVLHGPFGEDGTIQGLFELLGIPYVGPGVLSSAVCMDKDVTKRLLREANLPTADYMLLTKGNRGEFDAKDIVRKFGLPLFVKPANMGSSVGVSKVRSEAELQAAIDVALHYDRKVLIEQAINGSEIECAVLGNDEPKASELGRITYTSSFYSYEAKYREDQGTTLEIPAKLSSDLAEEAQATALQAYHALGCEGMARVDMFVTTAGHVIVNEVNTIPGFTRFSMYPKLWEASGLSYRELITRLIELAVERSDMRDSPLESA